MKKIILSLATSSLLLFGVDYDDNGTDYTNAVTQSFTEEEALTSLDTVNMILSFMKQSRAGEFLNEGNYTALVKESATEGSANDGKSGTVEKLIPIVLNVTGRTTPTDPMVVNMWMDQEGPTGPMRIIGKIIIEKGVTPQYALGKFVMNFKGYGIENNGSTTFAAEKMQGVLSVDRGAYNGQIEVQYKNSMKDDNNNSIPFEVLSMNMQVNAVDTNVSDEHPAGYFAHEKKGRGVAFSQYLENGETLKTKKLSFKDTAYKLADTDDNNVESFDKSSKYHKVYRYGLFHDANGSKVELNSGFPFTVTDTSSRGYAGYYGLWSESALPNGTAVTQEGTGTNFTTTSSPGKLWKHTKTGILMNKLASTKIHYNGYVLEWDNASPRNGTTGNFKVLGEDNHMGGITGINETGSYLFDSNESNTTTDTGMAFQINEWSKGWSEALNAPISIRSDYRSDTNASYHIEEVVTATDLNLTSFSFERVNTENPSADSVVLVYDQNDSNFTIGRSFNFSSDDLMLRDRNASDANVTIASDINLTGTNYEFGVRMSPMIEESSAGAYNEGNFWTAFEAEVFYSWETGQQKWNQFTGLKDGNDDVVSFDAPIVFPYEHTDEKDINATSNAGFYSLSYDGFSLQVPWEFNTDEEEWQPKINIKSGTELTKDGTSYRIKVLDQGIILRDDNSGLTDDLEFDSNRTGYTGPEHNATGLDIEKPSVAPVIVIKGECIDGNCSIPTD